MNLFLLTGNVGSVFENIDAGLSIWLNELIVKVKSQGPDFVALHFQETGGKHYKNGSKVIPNFFGPLVEVFTMAGYCLIEGIVDSDSDVEQQFTALSNIYFIRKNCQSNILIWDFENATFVPVNPIGASGKLFIGKEVNLTSRIQKIKFPQQFFPNCKWSRKGFARTRWRFNDTILDFVNIHLFHDSSNLVAASGFPSLFSQNRQRALNFVIDKYHKDDLMNVPLFIFGDFNFRVNCFNLIEMLRKEVATSELNNAPLSKEGSTTSELLIIDAKKFSVPNHEQRFKDDWKWLRAYDFELSNYEALIEMEIGFHPTYPFDESDPVKFMKTRVPSWCDRVLFTDNSKNIISNDPEPEYNLIGANVCMGDHKPVYLNFHLKCANDPSKTISESPPSDKVQIDSSPLEEEEEPAN